MSNVEFGLDQLTETRKKIEELQKKMEKIKNVKDYEERLEHLTSVMLENNIFDIEEEEKYDDKPRRGFEKKEKRRTHTHVELSYIDGEKEVFRWLEREKEHLKYTQAYRIFLESSDKNIYLPFINEQEEEEFTVIRRETLKKINIKFEKPQPKQVEETKKQNMKI